MLKIRLARGGTKHRPFYRITVADSRKPRDGRYIKRIGFYNPQPSGKDVPLNIDVDALNHHIAQGAQMSGTVAALVRRFQREAAATPAE